ncbi:hypothetical protein evm_011783 [Chilo suppressalis]|nr:hypothetical protein evm_011783 [Chilo suppressalis]
MDGVEEHADSVNMKTRKRRHSSRELTDLVDLGGPREDHKRHKSRARTKHEESDGNEAAKFLDLEREQLDMSRRLCDTVQNLATELTRLTDIMGHIRDVLVNNRIDI